MADEVAIIRIIPEGVATGIAPQGSISGGAGTAAAATKGMGGAFKGALSALGLGSVIGIVVTIASTMKGLMAVVGGILKMVGFLLKPIADVITVLLMPILYILKPIVILVNQIMAPFIKLAMQVMREGAKQLGEGNVGGAMAAFAGAGAIMMAGLNSVIIALSAGVVKMVLGSILDIGKTIFSAIFSFSSSLQGKVVKSFDDAKNMMESVVNTGAGSASALMGMAAAEIAETFNVNTDVFREDVANNIYNIFDAKNNSSLTSIIKKLLNVDFKNGSALAIQNSITNDEDSLSKVFVDEMDKLKKGGSEAIKAVVKSWSDEINKIKETSIRGGSYSGGTVPGVPLIGNHTYNPYPNRGVTINIPR